MSVKIESPAGEEALTEFVLFQHRVYEYRSARWAAMVAVQLPILMGEGPFAAGPQDSGVRGTGRRQHRRARRRDNRQPLPTSLERTLGHIVMFEAMPGTRDAVNQMMDAASEWMKSNGATAARAGYGLLEFPFVIDDYETLPPDIARQNPAYYHALLKDAGFETERGWVDYKIEVTPELVARYESALEASRRAGFQIVALKDLPPRAASAISSIRGTPHSRVIGVRRRSRLTNSHSCSSSSRCPVRSTPRCSRITTAGQSAP